MIECTSSRRLRNSKNPVPRILLGTIYPTGTRLMLDGVTYFVLGSREVHLGTPRLMSRSKSQVKQFSGRH